MYVYFIQHVKIIIKQSQRLQHTSINAWLERPAATVTMRRSPVNPIMLASGSTLLPLSSLCGVWSAISSGSATSVRTWCLPVWLHIATLCFDSRVAVLSAVRRVTCNYHTAMHTTQHLHLSPPETVTRNPRQAEQEKPLLQISYCCPCVRACMCQQWGSCCTVVLQKEKHINCRIQNGHQEVQQLCYLAAVLKKICNT